MDRARVMLASGNLGKLAEWRRLLCGSYVDLTAPKDSISVEEDGDSYCANALLKARGWGSTTELAVLAEDSGLEVEALGGRPGVYSARMGIDDASCIKWLLTELDGCGSRRARFVASSVLLAPDRLRWWAFEGYCYGHITLVPRGDGGFGYDPVFMPDGFGETFAQMGDRKESISHRGESARKLLDFVPYVVQSLDV